jgi:branched-chain amino acid transport system ATP-binding protein
MSRELLVAKGVSAGYHGHPIVHDLDLVVHEGEVVVLLGPNGAGKTTTLLTLSGDLPHLSGEVVFDGKPTSAPLHRRAHAGLSFVTEERSVFMRLSVAENLRVGRTDVGRALELFPELKPLMRRRAGLLSGGEQQMLSLARALAREPKSSGCSRRCSTPRTRRTSASSSSSSTSSRRSASPTTCS